VLELQANAGKVEWVIERERRRGTHCVERERYLRSQGPRAFEATRILPREGRHGGAFIVALERTRARPRVFVHDGRCHVIVHGSRPTQLDEAFQGRDEELLVQSVQARRVKVDPARRTVVCDGNKSRARERLPVRRQTLLTRF
jgi:hypothetical protein